MRDRGRGQLRLHRARGAGGECAKILSWRRDGSPGDGR